MFSSFFGRFDSLFSGDSNWIPKRTVIRSGKGSRRSPTFRCLRSLGRICIYIFICTGMHIYIYGIYIYIPVPKVINTEVSEQVCFEISTFLYIVRFDESRGRKICELEILSFGHPLSLEILLKSRRLKGCSNLCSQNKLLERTESGGTVSESNHLFWEVVSGEKWRKESLASWSR